MLENVLARWALMELSVIHVPRDFQVKTVKSATMDSMDILTAKVGFFNIPQVVSSESNFYEITSCRNKLDALNFCVLIKYPTT